MITYNVCIDILWQWTSGISLLINYTKTKVTLYSLWITLQIFSHFIFWAVNTVHLRQDCLINTMQFTPAFCAISSPFHCHLIFLFTISLFSSSIFLYPQWKLLISVYTTSVNRDIISLGLAPCNHLNDHIKWSCTPALASGCQRSLKHYSITTWLANNCQWHSWVQCPVNVHKSASYTALSSKFDCWKMYMDETLSGLCNMTYNQCKRVAIHRNAVCCNRLHMHMVITFLYL